jgi:hypothetical protein
MRRVMLLVVSVLTLVTMALSPAFAHDNDGDGWDEENGFWVVVPVFISSDDVCDWDNCDGDDHDWGWGWQGDWEGDCDYDWDGPVTPVDCWD